MRTLMATLVLLPLVPARAEDTLADALRALAEVRDATYEPGAAARVNPALDQLEKFRDPAVVRALAEYVVFTLAAEDGLVREIKKTQRRGKQADERRDAIDAELKHLEIRRRAGATDVGPRIEALGEERRQVEAVFIDARDATHRLDRALGYGRTLRERLVVACATAVRALPPAQLEAGLRALRAAFDLKDPAQALLLVRVLRDSRTKEAAPHLIDVMQDANVKRPAALQAVLALAALENPKGILELADMWEKDTAGLANDIRYALSMAAKKPIDSPAAARAWAKSLAR